MLDQAFRRIRYWLMGDTNQAELDEEMRLHLELRAQKLQAGGLEQGAATNAARRSFGNQLQLQERSREMWINRLLDDLARDIRIGYRGLRRNPAFTFAAILTLALGIGANTAIFQLIDAIRLRSLPVKDPQQLVLVQLADRKGWRGSQTKPWPTLTNPQWEFFRDNQKDLSGVLAWSANTLGLGEDPRPVRGVFVSGDFFRVLGVNSQLGRVFSADEDRRGCGVPGVVLSDAFWKNEFAGDNAIIGRKVILNHQPVEVVGVSGPGFTGLEIGRGFDVAVPICSQAKLWNAGNWLDEGAVWWLTVMGRSPSNQSPASVDARLRALSPALFEATLSPKHPRENASDYRKMSLRATPGGAGVSDLRETFSDPLTLIFATTGLVLLLACANLGNMILARASARGPEFALRLSIGASRVQLLRQLMVENGLLALGGTAAGLLVASTLARFLVSFLGTEGQTLWIDLQPDIKLVGFSALLATVSCVAFGLLPAWRATRANASDALKSSGRATSARSASTLHSSLVVGQVTVSVVLVFGALLFTRTLTNVLAVDVGFRPDGIVTSWIDYSRVNVPAGARLNFQREMLAAIRAVPGVVSAAETEVVPLSGAGGRSDVWRDGAREEQHVSSATHPVSGGYFETMGMKLLAGRDFDQKETPSSPRVAVINQALADQLRLGPNPIGQRFRKQANPWQPETVYEVIGLVGNTKYWSVKESVGPVAYYSTNQDADLGPNVRHVIRLGTSGSDGVTAIRKSLKATHAVVGMDFQSLDATIQNGLLRERLLAMVSGFFGVLATLIAAVGLYGMLSYQVVRRTNEIGIRVALGATPIRIVRAVMASAVTLVAFGLLIGSAVGVASARAARSLLFGLEPFDPLTLALASAVMAIIALGASGIPALRAVRIDPLTALRKD